MAIKVTQAQAVAMFQDPKQVSGTTFIGIDTLTIPALLGGKKNPMKDNVQKLNMGSNVMVFQNKTEGDSAYVNKVKRHMEACGLNPDDFTPATRDHYERVGGPILQHVTKGTLYLEVIFIQSGSVSYRYQGEVIQKEDIQGLKPSSEGKQGGLAQADKVKIRTFKMDSIIGFRLNSQEYIIEN